MGIHNISSRTPSIWCSLTLCILALCTASNAETPSPILEDEASWLATEILQDVLEMSSYCNDRSSALAMRIEANVKHLKGGFEPPSISVSGGADTSALHSEWEMSRHFWAWENYAPFAVKILDKVSSSAAPEPASIVAPILSDLEKQETKSIGKHNIALSKELSAHPDNPILHELAAVTIGVYAMRDAVPYFTDTRRYACRMAAHLSMARAISPKPSHIGILADSLISLLVGRQAESLALVEQLPEQMAAYKLAIRLRSTGDWRLLTNKATATRLERNAWARAAIANTSSTWYASQLSSPEELADPDLGRAGTCANSLSVEAGHRFVSRAIVREIAEYQKAFETHHQTSLTKDNPTEGMNILPGRCIQSDDTNENRMTVLSWGHIADFHQRHLLGACMLMEEFLGGSLGMPGESSRLKVHLEKSYSGLRLYPLLCGKMELRAFKSVKPDTMSAIEKVLRPGNQGDVPLPLWRSVAGASSVSQSAFVKWVNDHQPWNTSRYLLLRMSPKLRSLHDADKWTRATAMAPRDIDLLGYRANAMGVSTTDVESLRNHYRDVQDYNFSIITKVGYAARNTPAKCVEVMTAACEVNPDFYIDLGRWLETVDGGADAAIASYEKALALARSRVSLSHSLDWLARQYLDRGNHQRALQVAKEASSTYSAPGLRLEAQVLEEIGDLEGAEKLLKACLERYPKYNQLVPFYARNRARSPHCKLEWEKVAADIFPDGFETAQIDALDSPPKDGVAMEASSRHGTLKLGTQVILVAWDGIRVRNERQFRVVGDLSLRPDFQITYWIGGSYVEEKVRDPERRINFMNFKTYQPR